MKKVLAIILVVALSAICLTGCGFDEEGEMDEGSVLSSGVTSTKTTSIKTTDNTKSTTVNTETAEINVEKVLLGDISQEEVDDINGRINWLIGYTNDMIDELKGDTNDKLNELKDDTKANKKDIAKYKEEYDEFTKELEEQLAAIDEELSKDAESIGNIFERLDWQDFSIKKLANNVKQIFKTLSFYGKQIFNLDKNLKKETEERKAKDNELVTADNELDTRVGANETSITGLQGQIDEHVGNLIYNDNDLYTKLEALQNQLNDLKATMATLEALEKETDERKTDDRAVIENLKTYYINDLIARVKALEDAAGK